MLKRLGACLLIGLMLVQAAAAEGTASEPAGEPETTEVVSTEPADYPIPKAEFEFGIQAGEGVEDSFFDDAVFIGDSISLKLYYYVKNQRRAEAGYLGEAKFLTAGSLGSGNALWSVSDKSVHPSYQGKKMLLEDAVAAMGAKKVYIMLGMNDVTLYGAEGAVDNMTMLIDRILEKSPDAKIYVQSATPRVAGKNSNPTNRMLFDYDLKLLERCAEREWSFVDVASVMRDENGDLYEAYCSDPLDMGMHFTDEACKLWVEYLRTHTGENE